MLARGAIGRAKRVCVLLLEVRGGRGGGGTEKLVAVVPHICCCVETNRWRSGGAGSLLKSAELAQ